MSSPKLSAPEPHRLFSFEHVPDATHHTLTDVTPPSEARHTRLQLDLRLVNCVHGKLSQAAEDFASLLVFSLESRTDIGGSKSFQVLGINLEFDREIPLKDDSIEVLKTGEDESLGADVYLNKSGVSWSNGTPKNTIRFGVLIRRNFNDLFIGTFKLTLADKQLRHLESRDDADPILFDPSAGPIGGLVDTNNLQAASIQILWSLGAPPQTDAVESTKKTLSSATGNEQVGKAFTDQSNTPSISNGSTVPSSKTGKAKNLMMYHHKQRQVYEPQDSKAGSSRGLSGQDLEMQPLRSGDIDEQIWSDPIRFITSHEVGFKMFGMHFTATGTRCIRSIKMKLTSTNDAGEIEEYETAGHWSIFGMMVHKKKVDNGAEAKDQDRYLVVGRMSTNGFLITEKMLQYKQNEEEHILRKLHRFIRSIRGARGMLFSLKGVSGFGLYQCDAVAGHHTRVQLNENQRNCLQSLYNSYKWRREGAPEYLWDDWIFKHLNDSSTNPAEGKYSIEILLSWSVWRLSFATSIPVILSLAVGLWYQAKSPKDGSDPTGTAWIIATYIITAGALIIAFLGVATGLEQS